MAFPPCDLGGHRYRSGEPAYARVGSRQTAAGLPTYIPAMLGRSSIANRGAGPGAGRRVGVLLVVILVAALVIRRRGPAQPPPHAEPPHTEAPPAAEAAAAPRPPPTPSARVEPPAALPGSLEGTEPDGEIRADDAGHLVIDLE